MMPSGRRLEMERRPSPASWRISALGSCSRTLTLLWMSQQKPIACSIPMQVQACAVWLLSGHAEMTGSGMLKTSKPR